MKIETTEIQVKIERYSEKLNDSMKFEEVPRKPVIQFWKGCQELIVLTWNRIDESS